MADAKTKKRHTPSEDELAFVEELGLPQTTSGQQSMLDVVAGHIRTAKANRTNKALFIIGRKKKDEPATKPSQLNGHDEIKFVPLDCTVGTLNGVVKAMRGQGTSVIAYAGGFLVPLRGLDD